jgi:hypothetical protein
LVFSHNSRGKKLASGYMDSTPDDIDNSPVTIALVPVQVEAVPGKDFPALLQDIWLDMMRTEGKKRKRAVIACTNCSRRKCKVRVSSLV